MRFPRIQFSLLGMMCAMAIFGVALACLLKFGLSLALATIIWGLVLLLLMVSPMLAFVGRPERRTFYAGFAWFGWMYVLVLVVGFLSFSPTATNSIPPLRFPQMTIERGIFVLYKWIVPPSGRIFTTQDPEDQYSTLAANYGSGFYSSGGGMGGMGGGGIGGGTFGGSSGGFTGGGFVPGGGPMPAAVTPSIPIRYVPWEIFRDLAHAALTLLWAAIGGGLAVLLACRHARRKNTTAASPNNDS